MIIDGALGFGARTTGMAPGDASDPMSEDNPLVGFLLSTPEGNELGRYVGRHAFEVDENSQALTVPDVFVPVDADNFRRRDVVVVHLAIRDSNGVDRWAKDSIVIVR